MAFEVEGKFTEALDCNCSLCRRRGGLLAFVPREKLVLKTPEDNLSTYTFNRHVFRHHFCANCGIAPFGEAVGPNGAAMASINLRCIPAVDVGADAEGVWRRGALATIPQAKRAYIVCTTAKMVETTGAAGKIFAALVFCSQHLK